MMTINILIKEISVLHSLQTRMFEKEWKSEKFEGKPIFLD